MEKGKTKKKAMTLEDLAAAIQQDFSRMATKDDVAQLRREMATKEELGKLREELADGLGDVRTKISDVQEQIAGLRYAKEIDELRARVVRIEEKLDIKPGRRAA
jgi:Zn-finger domain-containing protein